MILADTSAVIALIDRDDRHHVEVRDVLERSPAGWVLPWAILPEVDYILSTRVGRAAEEAFVADLADGAFSISWGTSADLLRAHALLRRYASLGLGLVDAAVMAMCERLRAEAVVTLDLRHYGAVALRGRPRILPRDRRTGQ